MEEFVVGGGILGFILWAIVALIGLAIYFVPTIVAFQRNVDAKMGVALVNIFLGWTFLGWAGALVWALMADRNRYAGRGI